MINDMHLTQMQETGQIDLITTRIEQPSLAELVQMADTLGIPHDEILISAGSANSLDVHTRDNA